MSSTNLFCFSIDESMIRDDRKTNWGRKLELAENRLRLNVIFIALLFCPIATASEILLFSTHSRVDAFGLDSYLSSFIDQYNFRISASWRYNEIR